MITYDDFMKVELKVATVLEAERVPGADKLLKLRIKMGEEERTLAAGIAQYYAPEELVGKQLIVVANLEPKKLRGIESNGMLLAACTEDDSQVVFVTPEKQIPDGSRVR
ncbi:Methionine--tRNA ligase [Candidatus Norongarragalina meridionalis]|nr:Methionine--tRNA ligase [Candidatus Norongarragalina meridionalis]